MPSVIGDIREKWLSLGGASSFLGQPLTDELTTPDGVGRYNHFQGGSIYWVIAGSMLVRQRIVDITEDQWDDGSACAGLFLDPDLVPLIGRPTRPFQGWRYLQPEAAPADLDASVLALGEEALPHLMRRELRALCLI